MKYKIVKYIERYHRFDEHKGRWILIEVDKYYAKRKGRIFGFWHDVGDFIWDTGGGHIMLNIFDSQEEAESYTYCFHKEHYGDVKYEIVSNINFE